MNSKISSTSLQQIEWVSRHLMALILLTAGISKFFSGDGFAEYYVSQFADESLRLQFPDLLITLYLNVIPFIEIGLGVCLFFKQLKPYTVFAWYGFMASLLVGHYVLQEWSAVNQMLAYFFLGMICHALPCEASDQSIN